ncbi:MAG: phosphate ABC transporter permease PstA [Fimbriimonas sp.]
MSLRVANPALAKRRKFVDGLFRTLCMGAAGVGVLLLIVFLWKILQDGLPRLSPGFVTGELKTRANRTGIWEPILGSLYVMVLTGLIAVPIGVSAAVYLEEFTLRKNRFTQFIQLNIANLAGVPSIVYGLLGLALFVRWMNLGTSIIAGALTMSLLILPMVIIVTQEALKAVPRSYREASLALGSTPWQAIRHQVIPNAAAGIFTGIILAVSRAIGETAPLLVVGAASFVTSAPENLKSGYTALPIKIFDWSLEARNAFHQVAASSILVLIVTLLMMNSIAIYLRAKARAKQAK